MITWRNPIEQPDINGGLIKKCIVCKATRVDEKVKYSFSIDYFISVVDEDFNQIDGSWKYSKTSEMIAWTYASELITTIPDEFKEINNVQRC